MLCCGIRKIDRDVVENDSLLEFKEEPGGLFIKIMPR